MAIFMTHIYFLILSSVICKATVVLPQSIAARPISPLFLSHQSPSNPWEIIANVLHETPNTIPAINNCFALFVHLRNIIPNHHLNEHQKSQLLQFYVLLFQKLDLVQKFTQNDLVEVIE
eukprot:554835_1